MNSNADSSGERHHDPQWVCPSCTQEFIEITHIRPLSSATIQWRLGLGRLKREQDRLRFALLVLGGGSDKQRSDGDAQDQAPALNLHLKSSSVAE